MAHADFAQSVGTLGKSEGYEELSKRWSALYDAEAGFISNAANLASLLFNSLSDVNWAGFYFFREESIQDVLWLGPFQGKPACLKITNGQGVCGHASQQRQIIIVDDVHQFPGHIACDDTSRSEIVLPLIRGGQVIGVLDLDSPVLSRFDAVDAAGLEKLLCLLLSPGTFPDKD